MSGDANRTPDRSQIDSLSRAQARSAALAKRELGNVWAEIADWEPARQRDALLELVPAIIDKYADTSSVAAAEWYQRVRDKWISDDFKARTPVKANDDISKLIRANAGVLFGDDADPGRMLRFLNAVVDKGVKQGGRDTIRYNAKRDPKKPRYARVPSGAKTCAFCAMLASRGWVYESAETAGAMSEYHSDCDCEIVPSWDKDSPNVEGYDPEKLYEDYEKAYKAAGDNPTMEDVLAAMRSQPGKYTDGRLVPVKVPKDWKQPHAQNEDRLLSMKGLADVTDEEWYRRQERAEVPHSVDTLYPQEIVFLERFQNLGNHVEWIPRDKENATATNDFRWIETNELCELKSMAKADFGKIADRITKAVRSAKENHDVVKDCFVIDLGQAKRKDKLVHQLERYNDREWKIRRLFIFDGEGFSEIKLK